MMNAYLGIDVGTQGLSVVLVDDDGNVVGQGDGHYEMVDGLESGCYEQRPVDWEAALVAAMIELRNRVANPDKLAQIRAIGISGQMHGEVHLDQAGDAIGTARLWCDSRNGNEGIELTEHFGVKIPKRMTVARWLWTIRNQPEKATRVIRLTTPGGWLAYRLTGELNLGIGDASGMFPIDQTTLDFDASMLAQFNEIAQTSSVKPLRELLPSVRRAGHCGGVLNEFGSRLVGLPSGIPVAPAEGDQPASLAGSMIGASGMVAVSFGTSVCANSVGDRAFQGVSPAVDHFCAPDGKPINMVFLRNGTTFMNAMAEMFAVSQGATRNAALPNLMAQAVASPPDCGGVIAVPFLDDEPGLGITCGGQGALTGFTGQNAIPGNAIRAALLATMYNLRMGIEVLDQQGYPRTELILSGGLTKTPQAGQILADVMQTPVTVLHGAAEGCAFGASLLARYGCIVMQDLSDATWEGFLQGLSRDSAAHFEPQTANAETYAEHYRRYRERIGR